MSSRIPQVVVGTDGSPGSGLALDWAAAEASSRGWPLMVLEASEPDWVALDPGVTAVPTPAVTAQPSYVDVAVERIAAEWPDLDVSGALVAGHASPVLIDASRQAGLIVVGARGRSRVAEVLLGSVSRHVSAHAHCPVVVVHGHPRAELPVAVGIDGSEGSMAALRAAAGEATAHGVPLLVVHTWFDHAYTGYGIYTTPVDLSDELRAAAQEVAGRQVERLREEQPDLEVVLRVREGHPVTALVHASHEAQLVAVGAHGRGVFPGMRLGGVASGVLHGSACPVMVAPAA